MTVTSQQSALPFCQGTRESPSGRFPWERDKPVGSLTTGTPAAEKLRAINSFRELCLMVLPGAFLQTRLWRPQASTIEPEQHSCGEHKSCPSLRPTATLTASSSNCRPHEAIERTNSQSPHVVRKQLRKRHGYEVIEFSDDSTTALSANTPGRSQTGCLGGRISGSHRTEPTKRASMTEGKLLSEETTRQDVGLE